MSRIHALGTAFRARLGILMRSQVINLIALAILAAIYALPVLMRPGDQLPLGGDFDAEIALYAFTRQSLLNLQWPLWNPYYTTGQPYLADPTASYLNPLALAPIMVFGVIAGAKVAIVVALFLAGVGQWLLGLVAGLSRGLRLWSAALFLVSGSLAARFSAGHFAYILTYAFVPLSLAFILLSLRDRRPYWIALAAVCVAMPVMSGNPYYFLYIVIAGGVTSLTHGIIEAVKAKNWRPVLRDVGLYACIVIFAVGLTAVRWIPTLELLPRMFRVADAYSGSQQVHGVVADLLLFPRRLYAVPSIAGLFGYGDGAMLWWEYYAFLGPLPLLGLVFLGRACQRAEAKKQVIVLGLLAIASVLLIANAYPYSPFHWMWTAIPALGSFRFPVRALVLLTSSLLVLSAIGFAAWQAQGRANSLKIAILGAGLAVAVGANMYGIYADQPVPETGARQAVAWVRQHDPGVYYVQILARAPGEVRWRTFVQYDMLAARLKILDSYWGWYLRDSPALERAMPQGTSSPPGAPGALNVRAKYMIMPEGQGAAFSPDGYRTVKTIGGADVLETANVLPYSFVVPENTSTQPESVRPLSPETFDPGKVIVQANANQGERVVVLETYYPGWTVRIDDRPVQPVTEYGKVLSVKAIPGTHRYTFEYSPASVRSGFIVSLITVGLLIALMIAGRKFKRMLV